MKVGVLQLHQESSCATFHRKAAVLRHVINRSPKQRGWRKREQSWRRGGQRGLRASSRLGAVGRDKPGARGDPSTGWVLTSKVTAHRGHSLHQPPQAHQWKEPNPESFGKVTGNGNRDRAPSPEGPSSQQTRHPQHRAKVCPGDWIRARTRKQHSQHSRDQRLKPELRWGS